MGSSNVSLKPECIFVYCTSIPREDQSLFLKQGNPHESFQVNETLNQADKTLKEKVAGKGRNFAQVASF